MPADVLPLWVADMDFETSSYIEDALVERAKMGIYGYSDAQTPYFEAVAGWMKRHHNWEPKEEWLIKTPGVVFALAMAVKAYTAPGDAVLIQSPVYYPFSEVIADNGRRVVSSTLVLGDDNRYHMDVADFEEKLKAENVKLFFLCNPHNPTGELWTREELAEIGRLAAKYGVPVVSDEIHCDLTDPGSVYTPFASVNEECAQNAIVTVSPSKTFNIPGINTSFVIVPNEGLRGRVFLGLDRDQVGFPSAIAIEATEAAYGKGEAWVEEVREVLARNKERVVSFLHKELPQLHVTHREATYLVWIDCSAVTDDADKLVEHIHKTTGLVVSPGSQFRGNGRAWIRLNPATQPERLEEILRRFAEGVRTFAA